MLSFNQNVVIIMLILQFTDSMQLTETKQSRKKHVLHIYFCQSICCMDVELWLSREVAKMHSHINTGRVEYNS